MAISIGSAVSSGFNLVGKRPLSVLSWGIFISVAVFVLIALIFAIVGFPLLARLIALRGHTPSPEESAQLGFAMLGAIWPAMLLFLLGSVVVGAVVQGAVIRSILTPEQRGFAYLRLGRAEGALMLLALLYIPIFAVLFVASIVFLGLVGLAGQAIPGSAGSLFVFLACVTYALAVMWFALRFSLAGPMTFAAGSVRLFSSWELTKGEGWRLFGLAWVLVVVWIAVAIGWSIISFVVNAIFGGVAMASIFATVGGAPAQPDTAAIISRLPFLLLALIPSFVMGAAFNGLMQAIGQGPWADVYRQLKGPDLAATFS